MNYQMLKSLIDSLIQNFRCPNCQWEVNENNVEIVGAAWSTLNINMHCECEKSTFVKAELSHINLWNIMQMAWTNPEEFKANLQDKIESIKQNMQPKTPPLQDKEILEVRNILKWSQSVEDIFRE